MIHAAAIEKSGIRRTLPLNMATASGELCSNVRLSAEAQVESVQLAADRRIVVGPVRWWSGARVAAP
jgi:hypothetical protein